MQARRNWAPNTMSTGDRLPAEPRHAAGTARPGQRNARYVSASSELDANRTTPRFVATASIEQWRETIRDDAEVRAVLLNPMTYEPHADEPGDGR